MRMYNKTKTLCFYRYAGSGLRGVELKPDQSSPDLPLAKLQDHSAQNDLLHGDIGVLVTEAEKALLKGQLPEAVFLKLEILGTKPEVRPFETKPSIKVPPPPPDPKLQPIVIEKDQPKPKVDPVKQAVELAVANTAPADKAARLEQLKQSDVPAVAKAAAEVEAAKEMPPETMTTVDANPDAEQDEQDRKNGIDTTKYRNQPKHLLFSECLKRGINDITPGTKIKELRKRLAADDAKQAAAQPAGVQA